MTDVVQPDLEEAAVEMRLPVTFRRGPNRKASAYVLNLSAIAVDDAGRLLKSRLTDDDLWVLRQAIDTHLLTKRDRLSPYEAGRALGRLIGEEMLSTSMALQGIAAGIRSARGAPPSSPEHPNEGTPETAQPMTMTEGGAWPKVALDANYLIDGKTLQWCLDTVAAAKAGATFDVALRPSVLDRTERALRGLPELEPAPEHVCEVKIEVDGIAVGLRDGDRLMLESRTEVEVKRSPGVGAPEARQTPHASGARARDVQDERCRRSANWPNPGPRCILPEGHGGDCTP